MKDKIKFILSDARLDYLAVTPEFSTARGKLSLMLDKLEDGYQELPQPDIDYLSRLETHIKNIDPRLKLCFVNGEEVDVMFYTRSQPCNVQ